MKKAIVFLMIFWSGIAYSMPTYKIIKDQSKRDIKRDVEVVLSERATTEQLKKISNEIYKKGFERTFIGFRLASNDKGSFWAQTSYNPNLDIKIYGSTVEEHSALNKQKNDLKTQASIGSWRVNWGYEYTLLIDKSGDEFVLRSVFSNGETNETALQKIDVEGQTRYFTEANKDHGEFYVIAKNGDLQFWSKNGNYYTAPKEK